jgi:hypothetical protein
MCEEPLYVQVPRFSEVGVDADDRILGLHELV